MASATDSDSTSRLRRRASRLAVRLFAVHLALLVIPVVGVTLYVDGGSPPLAQSGDHLEEHARLLAAALSDSGELVEEEARLILQHAGDQSSRLRVLDRHDNVLADSLPNEVSELSTSPAVRVAIRSGGEPVGAVLATPNQVSAAAPPTRWSQPVVLTALALSTLILAAASSLVLSRRIARPLELLREEAAGLLGRPGRVRTRFSAAGRSDEIGELARALEELSGRLDRQLGQATAFASDLAHEVRNPLAGIRSAAELLSEVGNADERRHFAMIVETECARLDALLHAARESAALDAQLDAEPRARIPLQQFLVEVVERARIAAPVPIEFTAAAGAEALVVFGRTERLAQVFSNLLDNLVSFSPTGAPVAVALTPTRQAALVHLRDRGPGIPPEHLERIFERFFSYRPEGRSAGHTGSGLAIARTILSAYGGSVRAENAAEGGARFEVRLPRAEIADFNWRRDG